MSNKNLKKKYNTITNGQVADVLRSIRKKKCIKYNNITVFIEELLERVLVLN